MTAPGGTEGPAPGLGLGLDFGSTGVRAAFGLPGGPVRRLALSGRRWPWLLCEPTVAGPLPVTFPSLKSRLGSGRPALVGGVPTAVDEVVTGLLREVREQVEAVAGARIALTVISVPVSYRSAQRTALLDAARAAGLDEVRLIGDAMAAVIGHTEGRGSATCLVYGLGYGGFELGLVRAARERYRALGHETAASTGGRAFDDAALSGALRAVRGRAQPAGLVEAGWLRMRARVERIREELGAPGGHGAALLDFDLGGGPTRLRIERAELEAYLERHVRRTRDRARTLLDQSGMDARDVDTLLLVGGGTRLETIRSGVRGLGRDTVRAPDHLLATGALMHAARLAGVPPAGADGLAALEPADPSEDTLSDAPRLTVTLVSPPPPPPEPSLARLPPPVSAAPAASPGPGAVDAPDGPLDVARARELVARGQVGQARALLETIVTEARALLGSLGTDPSPRPPEPAPPVEAPQPPESSAPSDPEHWADRKAARRLATARDLLTEGRYAEAVGASHAAWQAAGEGTSGPDVLDAMIGVHCAAAMADFSPEHFPDAERWLRCAYSHDPTNARVRGLLAERTYRHAERLDGRGRHDEAVEALHRCLGWNPEHGAAQALLERLGRRGRNHRDRGGVPR
ncbi:Hsp70 family protein [Streptomyces bullii]|uniref:Hsp70 family protein n=1 Tax=Streptomyces bullii TaxID=349910 RepID=A0ABW0URM5_9ACTN